MPKKVQDIVDRLSSRKGRLSSRKGESIWDIIGAIGWGTKTTDYDAINKALREVFSVTAIDSIGNDVRQLATNVYKRAEQEERGDENFFGFSDDGWSDATNHIVGLGKQAYDSFMDDPVTVRTNLKKKGGDDWNVENFAYSFHT